jgi:hypothetical protein
MLSPVAPPFPRFAGPSQLPSTSLFKTLVTVSNQTTHVLFTANTSGVPFELTLATTETGGGAADAQTFVETNGTARSGTEDYGVATNWFEGAVPVANDVVYIHPDAGNILYGLAQSTVEIDGFHRPRVHAGHLGDGTNSLYLDVEDGKFVEIDYHFGPPSGASLPNRRTMLKFAAAPVVTVHAVPQANSVAEEDAARKPPTRLNFVSGASAILNVRSPDGQSQGQVGIAENVAAEASTLGTVNVVGEGADVVVGSGVTLTNAYKTAGKLLIKCAAADVQNHGGAFTKELAGTIASLLNAGGVSTVNGSGAVTAATATGGTIHLNTTGTTAQAWSNGGVVNCLQSSAARTISSVLLSHSSEFYGDDNYMTLSANIAPSGLVELEAV